MKIGKGTCLYKIKVTWPHQVKLGDNCNLEHSIYFHYDGIYSKGPSINIGNNVFIGNNILQCASLDLLLCVDNP